MDIDLMFKVFKIFCLIILSLSILINIVFQIVKMRSSNIDKEIENTIFIDTLTLSVFSLGGIFI